MKTRCTKFLLSLLAIAIIWIAWFAKVSAYTINVANRSPYGKLNLSGLYIKPTFTTTWIVLNGYTIKVDPYHANSSWEIRVDRICDENGANCKQVSTLWNWWGGGWYWKTNWWNLETSWLNYRLILRSWLSVTGWNTYIKWDIIRLTWEEIRLRFSNSHYLEVLDDGTRIKWPTYVEWPIDIKWNTSISGNTYIKWPEIRLTWENIYLRSDSNNHIDIQEDGIDIKWWTDINWNTSISWNMSIKGSSTLSWTTNLYLRNTWEAFRVFQPQDTSSFFRIKLTANSVGYITPKMEMLWETLLSGSTTIRGNKDIYWTTTFHNSINVWGGNIRTSVWWYYSSYDTSNSFPGEQAWCSSSLEGTLMYKRVWTFLNYEWMFFACICRDRWLSYNEECWRQMIDIWVDNLEHHRVSFGE